MKKQVPWYNEFRRIVDDKPCVLVTLIKVSGSAPRESGCRMIVAADEVAGSIGGGNLEYRATAHARELLKTAGHGSQHRDLVGLGPELNQCCGGAVALTFEVYSEGPPGWLEDVGNALASGHPAVLASVLERDIAVKAVVSGGEGVVQELPTAVVEQAHLLLDATGLGLHAAGREIDVDGESWWLERIGRSDRPLMLFGAGHVGKAVAAALSPLPFEITWIDSRDEVFPDGIDGGIQTVSTPDPAAWVARAGPETIFVVMTHSHQLDEDICFEVLNRDDFAWLGLIGSDTKRRRFIHRLEQRGIPAERLERLVCPVGLAGIRGKQPATIALSLAAQLMTEKEE